MWPSINTLCWCHKLLSTSSIFRNLFWLVFIFGVFHSKSQCLFSSREWLPLVVNFNSVQMNRLKLLGSARHPNQTACWKILVQIITCPFHLAVSVHKAYLPKWPVFRQMGTVEQTLFATFESEKKNHKWYEGKCDKRVIVFCSLEMIWRKAWSKLKNNAL